MKYSEGDIVTVKTDAGAVIEGPVRLDDEGDFYIHLRNVNCLLLTYGNILTEGIEIIKVKRQLPTKPGSVIRDIETRSGQKYNIGVLYGPSNLWHLYTTLGHSENITVESASNYIEHWEPDEA